MKAKDIMEAEKEAFEICLKFKSKETSTEQAKNYALICVDEILMSWQYKPQESIGGNLEIALRGRKCKHYMKVRREIEKL